MNTNKLIDNELSKINQKTGEKLFYFRSLLAFSKAKIGDAAGIAAATLDNFEKGESGGYTDKLNALILFYGYTLKEFYDFSKPLPTAVLLKSRMKRYHVSIGSDAYKIIYERPDLIDLIEFRLLQTELFNDWTDTDTVIKFCWNHYKYSYIDSSTLNTLDLAVKKRFLVRHPTASPKQYKKA